MRLFIFLVCFCSLNAVYAKAGFSACADNVFDQVADPSGLAMGIFSKLAAEAKLAELAGDKEREQKLVEGKLVIHNQMLKFATLVCIQRELLKNKK